MILQVIRPDDHASHGEDASVSDPVPFPGHVKGDADIGILDQHRGDRGHGKHADSDVACCGSGCEFRAVHEDYLHVLVGIDSVFRQDVAQDVLGVGSLSYCVNRLPFEVADRRDGLSVLQDVEDTCGVEGSHPDSAGCLVVEGCGGIGGDCSNIYLSRRNLSDHVGGFGKDRDGVAVLRLSVLILREQVTGSDSRGSLQDPEAYLGCRVGEHGRGRREEKHDKQNDDS